MNELFLTREELVELTGFRAAHCQVRWLDRNRWRYALTRRKEPRVARQHFQERMGCSVASTTHAASLNFAAAIEQPNFAALDRR
jgi:hypothetical protein